MPFPNRLEDFLKAGYEIDKPGVCRGCKAEILWVTTPNGHRMPIDPIPVSNMVTAHFATCPMANAFRRKGWKVGSTAT